jgi:hypothetical protein
VLKRGDEGELDGLALLVASLGRGIPVFKPERLIGVRLDPYRLDERLARVVLVTRRAVVDRQDALGPSCDRVKTSVGCDPVEPGTR